MADLDSGWAISTPFPTEPLPEADRRAHLLDAQGEVLNWNEPARVRLGFAMSAPSPVAMSTLQDFLMLNPNNVGHHARFGEGKTGTRRLEKEALAALGGLLHGGALDGYITSGATEAAIASLRIGRNTLRAAGAQRIRVLAGDLCHHSLVKAAEILDIEFKAIPTGRNWVVSLVAFNDAVAAAIAEGCDAIVIAATAGYYNSGLCDPIDVMAEHARQLALEHAGRLHVYFHIDAAHGGFIYPFTNPELPFDFRNPGVHAIALDPHKSGQMPYSCGVLLTRKGLFEHVTRVDPNTLGVDETLLGSRSGAMAAALWAVLFSYGHAGYSLIAADCMRKRDAIRQAVTAADPHAELVIAPDAPVLAASFTTGQLPPQLCEDYRLVPISLPSQAGDRRLFYHFYAGSSLSVSQIEQFGKALTAAVHVPTGVSDPAGGHYHQRDHDVVTSVRGQTDCFRHFVVHPDDRRDPTVEGYSFHTFVMRRASGEPLQCEQRGDAQSGGPLHVYAPDLDRPFVNELFGVATEHYSLEILDRHQQTLSLVGAIHANIPLPDHNMRVLLNFEPNGQLRSLEYKVLGQDLTDEVQIFANCAVFKIGKASAGFRRPRSDDYSFSIDTSAEIRVHAIDGAAEPTVITMRHNADALLPRRRHLRREQFRRFPNRFFDLELDVEVGRDWQGRSGLSDLRGADAAGRHLLARSARLGSCELTVEFNRGLATVVARSLAAPQQLPRQLSAAWNRPSEVFAKMPVLNVRDPAQLEIGQAVEYAEQVHACFVEHALPIAGPDGFAVGGAA